MKAGLQLCYSNTFYQTKIYRNIFDRYVKFRPARITEKYKTEEWNARKHLKVLDNYSGFHSVAIGNNENDIFLTLVSGNRNKYRSITIVQDHDIFNPGNPEIESLTDSDEFIAGYLYNEDYEALQSIKFEADLSRRNFPPQMINSIKNTPYRLGLFDEKEYETRFNPGSSAQIDFAVLIVAWKMWFGKQFFKLVPKEKILAFPYATEIHELPNGQVFVQLYEKFEDPHTPDNVFRQWKWKEWIDYDGLIERYPW